MAELGLPIHLVLRDPLALVVYGAARGLRDFPQIAIIHAEVRPHDYVIHVKCGELGGWMSVARELPHERLVAFAAETAQTMAYELNAEPVRNG